MHDFKWSVFVPVFLVSMALLSALGGYKAAECKSSLVPAPNATILVSPSELP